MRLKKEFIFKLVSQILFFFVIFLNIYANEVRIVAKIENDITMQGITKIYKNFLI